MRILIVDDESPARKRQNIWIQYEVVVCPYDYGLIPACWNSWQKPGFSSKINARKVLKVNQVSLKHVHNTERCTALCGISQHSFLTSNRRTFRVSLGD